MGSDMRLYQCNICKKICAHGEEDPGDYETIEEHIVECHYNELLHFFTIYTLKGKDVCKG